MSYLDRRPGEWRPVVTGAELLALVMKAGRSMLAAEDHDQYLERREEFISLLKIAEHDNYCVPILIPAVQDILDEESRMRFDKKG